MVNVQKKKQVDNLLELLQGYSNFALVKFEKIPHLELEKLRTELKQNDSSFKVVKKSLFEKAVNKLSQENKKFKELQKKAFPLKENAALLVLDEDYMKGMSVFSKFAKTDEGLSFKLGILDGNIYMSEDMQKISTLPSKDQLRAQVLSKLNSVLAKLVYTLKFNTNKFVYIIAAKGGDKNG